MTKYLAPMLVAAVLAIASTARAAYPTLFGPTGGAALPTGDVIMQNELDVAVDYYNERDNNSVPVRANYGIIRGLEIGGLFDFRQHDQAWGVNAKYALPLFGFGGLALGGFYNATTNGDDKGSQIYLVDTMPFTKADTGVLLRGTLGVNYTWTDLAATGKNNGVRAYIGADATFPGINNAMLLAEYQIRTSSVPDARSVASVAVRYPFTPSLSAQVGFTNADPIGLIGTRDYRVFVGASLALGGTTTPVAKRGSTTTEVVPDVCQ